MKSRSRPFPPDQPATVTIRCWPADFEAERDRLESHGYYLVNCASANGKLVMTGTRKACQCDLCRGNEQS